MADAGRGSKMINQDMLNTVREYAEARPRSVADDKIIKLIDTIEALVPLAKLGIHAMREAWDNSELDYEDMQTAARKLGVIKEVEFNSEIHGEHEYAENGDPWFEFYEPELVAELENKETFLGREIDQDGELK